MSGNEADDHRHPPEDHPRLLLSCVRGSPFRLCDDNIGVVDGWSGVVDQCNCQKQRTSHIKQFELLAHFVSPRGSFAL